ncbi:MAG TPA: ABC transporter ATP-binding protein [Saprospiraceae bacterium]|nr:ABC transporter ATP-binding protein [Saprospiraceae bacterium]
MIKVQHLSKKFGTLNVLDQVNLNCEQGACIALIGPNGCGKTTLIKCILGMVIPTQGKILFKGEDIAKTFQYRQHIGYMPQIGRYPDHMSIGQILDMIKAIRQSHVIDEELIQSFRLNQMFNKKMSTLSGGTTQKVSATIAFLFNPDVLILDEPTAGLDPLSADILKEKIVKEKKKGKLVLITSHLLSELDDLITQIVYMQDGQINFHKSIDALRHETGQEKISKAISTVLTRMNHD